MISFEHDGERITFEPGDGFNSGDKATFPATYKRCLPLMIAMLKEIARLERDSRNRDMWKAQCARQAKHLEALHMAIAEHNAGCINLCDSRKKAGKTSCYMLGYDRECGDCPRDGILDLAYILKEDTRTAAPLPPEGEING